MKRFAKRMAEMAGFLRPDLLASRVERKRLTLFLDLVSRLDRQISLLEVREASRAIRVRLTGC
jgi:hypothetical protein